MAFDPEKLPDDLKEVYKDMQRDYTSKTTEAANIRKEAELRAQELEQRLKSTEQSLLSYKQANDEWSAWSKTVADIKPADETDPDDELFSVPGSTKKARVTKRPEDERLTLELADKVRKLDEKLGRTETALDMALQIDDLRHKYPNIDPKRVVQAALDHKLVDLEEARSVAYREEDVKAEVERQVQEKLKALDEERRTKVLEGGGRPGGDLFLKMPERPRGWEETSEDILRTIRADAEKL